jgi:hypothetical protein
MRPDADEKLMLVVVEADDVDGWIRAVEWEKFGVEDQGGCRAVVLLFVCCCLRELRGYAVG